MSNVESLTGAPLPHDPVPGIVKLLEAYLADARSGEVRGIVILTAYREGATEGAHASDGSPHTNNALSASFMSHLLHMGVGAFKESSPVPY